MDADNNTNKNHNPEPLNHNSLIIFVRNLKRGTICENRFCFLEFLFRSIDPKLIQPRDIRETVQDRLIDIYKWKRSEKLNHDIGENPARDEWAKGFAERFAEVYAENPTIYYTDPNLNMEEIYHKIVPKDYDYIPKVSAPVSAPAVLPSS